MLQLDASELVKNGSYINGRWHNSDNTFSVKNPADLQPLADVVDAGKTQAEQAVQAASDSFAGWAAKPAAERSALLLDWYQLVMKHQDDLARLMTLEQGKPLAEAKGEIAYGASYLQWFAEEAKRLYGVMDRRLADNDYLAGAEYSIADIALYAYTHVADEAEMTLDEYPGIRRWLDRVAEQPGHVLITQEEFP